MLRRLLLHKTHYFSKHPSRSLRRLYWSVGLKDLGLAAVTIFEPIFLYTLGYSLSLIITYYLIIYGLYIFIMPLVARWVGRWGLERSIFYSQFVLIVYFMLFLSIVRLPALFYIAPIIAALYKSLYWPAYHTDFILFSQAGQRGREVSGMETLAMAIYIIGPLVGGVILEWFNFTVLFVAIAVLFILSTLPLLKIKEIHNPLPFNYREVFSKLVDRRHRRSFFAYLGFGEELIVLTIWPIFIFLVVGDYLEVGSLTAIATLITSIIVLLLGKKSDKSGPTKLLRFGSIAYFIVWLVRGLAQNAWHVVGLDAGSRISKEMLLVPLESITYGEARKTNPLAYAVFFEQSLSVGKVLAGVSALVIFSIFSNPWLAVFLLSGGFSLFYLFLQASSSTRLNIIK